MAGILRERHSNVPLIQDGRKLKSHETIEKKPTKKKGEAPAPPVKRPKRCFHEGMRVWVANSNTADQCRWLRATVTASGKNGKVGVRLESGEVIEVSRREDSLLLAGNNNYAEVDDLTNLSSLNEAEVLESLECRFQNGQICSKAGITLVSLNPFKEIPGLYDDTAVQRCHQDGTSKTDAPHVFAVAEKAFSSLRYAIGSPNQSIIVSGESGAGKTWNTRCLMKYLTSVALYKNPGGFSPPPVKCIERRILDSNPILEAFGNAGTARNHNSSRFGKYIQLQFDRGSHIIGASIQTYLLEKTRLVHQADGETNFHIFYQIVKEATEEQRAEWGLTTHTGDDVIFAYLPLDDGGPQGANENQVFSRTQQAMENVGMTHMHQEHIFQVLSGILHLGNLEFTCDEEFDPCELDEEVSRDSLEHACRLLGLDPTSLTTSLIYRRITASHNKRQSVFMKPCSVEESGVRRDCVSKVIYARLFDWLVAFLNKHTSANQWHAFIGLLDIYGFESFASNSLEQLCINYANEKLQQHFVTHFLRAQQEEYEKEGISWDFCTFSDNQPCLETIEGKLSVFSLMNEECRLNRQSDPTSFEDKLLAAVESPFLTKAPMGHQQSAFTIKHFAGMVTYDSHGLIEKTKDPIPMELIEVLMASTNQFVTKIIQPEQERLQELQSKGSKSKVNMTVVSRFKESLGSLMNTLTSTTPHYIRCIKPNQQCQPDLFDSRFVASQLRACGVLETVAISAAGFPSKLSHADFCQRYSMLLPRKDRNGMGSVRDRCRLIYRSLFGGDDDKENQADSSSAQQLGKTKIFLREGQLEYLESQRLKKLSQCANIIQRAWRLHRALVLGEREWAASVIQAGYRGWRVRNAIKIMDHAARVIQHAMLDYLFKKRQERLDASDYEDDYEEAYVEDIEEEEQQEEKVDSPSIPAPKPPRKSVHFASNLTTVREIYSPSPVPTPTLTPSPQDLVPKKIVFTENSPDFKSLSPVSYHHGNKGVDRKDEEKEEEREMKESEDEGGVIATVTNILKKPAVEIALAGLVTTLLITGPLRWS
ncbi:unconventional myosin-XIX [Strongylocentrotus purpuratus]|uniref:Myosin motor domain-containing protein n=1 Tax=Strongylocentrotus purpuratus TaxID=7668 RepID=A0A7M7PAQ7_STRPU|nr:unconventional myosin-XIX [Strongylocentrotus purpuratus]